MYARILFSFCGFVFARVLTRPWFSSVSAEMKPSEIMEREVFKV